MTRTLSNTFEMTPIKSDHEISVPSDADINDTDHIIAKANADLDEIISHGMIAIRDTFEKADDWRPSDANRAREVGAAIMKATIDAIKQKQDSAIKMLGKKTDTPSVQNTTNIFADRNTILKMLRDARSSRSLNVDQENNS